ncbi:MAG: NADH-quinone oxidoreductase subunit NuoN, partial [Pedococcus sp.]
MPAVTGLSMPMVPAAFQAADFNYGAIAPMLIVVGGALVGVLVEAFAPRRLRHSTQVTLALGTLVAALVVLVTVSADEANRGGTLAQAVIIDGPSLFLQGTILVLSILGVLTMAEKFGGQGADAFTPMGAAVPGSAHEAAALRAGLATSEVFPLTMFAVLGMMLFPAAGDLLTMFVALEVLSLPLYLLSGLARRRRLLSQEASLKYFLLGAFSSAFFLFGAALLYGYAGSLYLADIAKAVSTAPGNLEGLLLPGVVFVLVGLLFKVGAVPFHSWTPDVYQGAPTPVTGFMAACTKVAAFGAILRIVYVGVEANRWDWRGGVIAVAALTMVVGAVLSVTQTDVKRLLAYSSIAHAGFILVAVLSFDRTGVSGTMFYLVAYGFMTIAAFAIVSMVRQGG